MDATQLSPVVDLTKIDPDKGFFDEFPRPTKAEWREKAEAALKGAPFTKVMYTETYNGFSLDPIYMEEDICTLPHISSMPGISPYVRGTLPGGYLQKPWIICQNLSESLPATFNEEARFDISRGQAGISMVLDEPTLDGLAPGNAAADTIGRTGLSLLSADDLKCALTDIDLQQTYLLCACGSSSFPLVASLASLLTAAELQHITACIGCDPLGRLAQKGSLPHTLPVLYDAMQHTMAWAANRAPGVQTVFIQGAVYNNAGASAVEETACILATAAEYIREMRTRGMAIDTIAKQIKIGISIGSDFFGEIARLRAIKLLWTQLVTAFGGNPLAAAADIHAESSAFNKTVFDPYVNMLRVTSEGFAAAVGGVNSMSLAPFDTPIRTPNRFSRRIARNVQIILRDESQFVHPIDMAGGSYYVEKLTDTMAQTSWKLFQDIEKAGGMFQALHKGMVQTQIAETEKKRSHNIQIRRDVILGTNMYANMSEEPLENQVPDYSRIEAERIISETEQKKRQDTTLQERLSALSSRLQAPQGKATEEAIEAAIAAIAAGATLADLHTILGTPSQPSCTVTKLAQTRSALLFEQLRSRAKTYLQKHGTSIAIFPANFGPLAQHKARVDFSKGFFEVAGFTLLENAGFNSAKEAADAAFRSHASIVVICSTDTAYPDFVPELAATLKNKRPDMTIIVAGKQSSETESAFRAAGVDEFIHVRANCYEINKKLQDTYMGEA